MISFKHTKHSNKIILQCQDKDIFNNIREHFSIKNTGASFARRKFGGRSFSIKDRKYAITPTGKFDIGLFYEIEKYIIDKQIVSDVTIDDSVTNLLKIGKSYEVHTRFNKQLRDYQIDVIDKALKLGWGTCVLGTGAGKTLVTAALIENYYLNSNNKNTFKCLVVVPDLGLVTQTYNEFLESGISFSVSQWTGKKQPDFECNVIICNMGILQSQFSQNEWITFVDLLIVDEAHKIKSDNKVSKIISSIKTPNRYGFTGTLPEDDYEKWFIMGKLGPVIYEKSSFELRSESYLTNVDIKIIKLVYNKPAIPKITDSKYRNELEFLYTNKSRNMFIQKLCNKLNYNTLILVNHINHGEYLYDLIKSTSSKQVFFIRGAVEVEERERIKQLMEKFDNIICIAISAIFSTGVNIHNIHNIMFVAGGKSFIRTVQSIGRGLRLNSNKEKLVIYDICDDLKYSTQHSLKRKDIYIKEKINYIQKTILI